MHQKDTSGGSHTTPTALTNKHVGRKLSSFDSLKRKASSSTAPRSTTTYPLAKPPHRPVTHGGTTRKSTITRGSGSTKESSGLGVSDQPHRSQSDSEDESEYSGEEENRERMKDDTTSVQSQHVTHTFQVQKTNQLLMRLIDHVKKTPAKPTIAPTSENTFNNCKLSV